MSTESNKTINRRLVEEGFNKGNLKVLDELVAPNFRDYVLEEMSTRRSGLPGTGGQSNPPSRGPEVVKQFISDMRQAFPDLRYTIDDTIAEGDKVVTRCHWEGTQKGEFMGLPPTGKHVHQDEVDIVRYVDGKVVEHWGYMDSNHLLQQLGVDRTP